ncbi:protein I'm not dead yet-like isoform X2 [Danaus plexippus]|uniref:protein I'm not dead yet-like isoform X2 n=1 Tax=Danaus plexippus TaxID=13037 RepID=UPI002AB0B5FF|nr:protein I'm not dead yet-like isoform X2 [Danaus plexippus]
MDTNLSEGNLVIITRKERIQRFIKVYRKLITFIITPFIWIPILCLGDDNAYISFYVFLVNGTYLVANIFHPGVTSLIPITIFTILDALGRPVIYTININNSVLDCLGVMMIVIAIEYSNIHKRIALKLLLTFGCSHFRLSFLMFAISMMLSMWCTNTMTCGIMMPIMKAVLGELERMGVLEIFEPHKLGDSSRYDVVEAKPSDFTIFYFLGIAYSSSIGGVSTFIGSESNKLFKNYCSTVFPKSPNLEAPHFTLLTLPGVLLMEICLYLWLNFYFLGMMRVQNYSSLQASLTSEEQQYVGTLLEAQYTRLGRISLHEMIVGSFVILTAILQASINLTDLVVDRETLKINSYMHSPSIICAALFFITPVNLDFIKNFRHNASNNVIFEAMTYTKMNDKFVKFLWMCHDLPAPALAFIVILFCKIMTEFANNADVATCLLPCIANLSILTKINPRYLMIGATLTISLPFHLLPASPAYAMVAAYAGIPPSKMMIAGIGPSVAAILINLFTTTVWSKVIWPDVDTYPD